MHPLLTRERAANLLERLTSRLGLYLLSWAPITAILTYLMAKPAGLGWWNATLVVVPLCLIYAFVCLSAWYSCKAAPIQTTPPKRLFVTYTVAAVLVSLLWVQVATLIAYLLSELHSFQGLDQKFAPQAPLLFAAGFMLYSLPAVFPFLNLGIEEYRGPPARGVVDQLFVADAGLQAAKGQVDTIFLRNNRT